METPGELRGPDEDNSEDEETSGDTGADVTHVLPPMESAGAQLGLPRTESVHDDDDSLAVGGTALTRAGVQSADVEAALSREELSPWEHDRALSQRLGPQHTITGDDWAQPLRENRLGKFVAWFEDNGYDDQRDWPTITSEELQTCGFKAGHMKKWARLLASLGLSKEPRATPRPTSVHAASRASSTDGSLGYGITYHLAGKESWEELQGIQAPTIPAPSPPGSLASSFVMVNDCDNDSSDMWDRELAPVPSLRCSLDELVDENLDDDADEKQEAVGLQPPEATASLEERPMPTLALTEEQTTRIDTSSTDAASSPLQSMSLGKTNDSDAATKAQSQSTLEEAPGTPPPPSNDSGSSSSDDGLLDTDLLELEYTEEEYIGNEYIGDIYGDDEYIEEEPKGPRVYADEEALDTRQASMKGSFKFGPQIAVPGTPSTDSSSESEDSSSESESDPQPTNLLAKIVPARASPTSLLSLTVSTRQPTLPPQASSSLFPSASLFGNPPFLSSLQTPCPRGPSTSSFPFGPAWGNRTRDAGPLTPDDFDIGDRVVVDVDGLPAHAIGKKGTVKLVDATMGAKVEFDDGTFYHGARDNLPIFFKKVSIDVLYVKYKQFNRTSDYTFRNVHQETTIGSLKLMIQAESFVQAVNQQLTFNGVRLGRASLFYPAFLGSLVQGPQPIGFLDSNTLEECGITSGNVVHMVNLTDPPVARFSHITKPGFKKVLEGWYVEKRWAPYKLEMTSWKERGPGAVYYEPSLLSTIISSKKSGAIEMGREVWIPGRPAVDGEWLELQTGGYVLRRASSGGILGAVIQEGWFVEWSASALLGLTLKKNKRGRHRGGKKKKRRHNFSGAKFPPKAPNGGAPCA